MQRPVVVRRPRRAIGARVQVGAAAAVVVAMLAAASQLVGNESFEPAFAPAARTGVKIPSKQQLDREQAILDRARAGEPVQLQGEVL